MSEMKTVILSGRLGRQFGRERKLAVCSPLEASIALSATVPGYEQAMLESAAKGISYICFAGRRNVGEDQLGEPVTEDVIRIVPTIRGAKSGWFNVVLGAAMIGLAAWNPALMGAKLFGTTTVGSVVGGMGIALTLGGVTQLLSPQQRGLSTRDNPENGASYNFNGPVNTTAQGNPVPVLYGEMMVGSAVVSAGIYSEDVA